ncbi:hypothetical protein V8G54_013107 [Vigna mungo]|uniref:Uncharacterized protein n=1 Tax=Vigna mungo TaxID=3915 RepID=A0AAQ3S4J0_VIGMU
MEDAEQSMAYPRNDRICLDLGKRGSSKVEFSEDEETLIIRMYKLVGKSHILPRLAPTYTESLLDRNKDGGNRFQSVKNEGKSKKQSIKRVKDAGERLRGKGKCLPFELWRLRTVTRALDDLWRLRTVTRALDDGDERNVLEGKVLAPYNACPKVADRLNLSPSRRGLRVEAKGGAEEKTASPGTQAQGSNLT